jgi:dipeptidyl aminopeptidase/acylaminoacyl peptidase
LSVVADINPELRNIRFGRIERIEWDTPQFPWSVAGGRLEGLYPQKAYGYILYPPDFDKTKKYPVFVEPYVAGGFNSSGGGEHLLHVYAANGFIVVNTAFPLAVDWSGRLGGDAMRLLFSADLGFPDLTMLAESTLRGLDVAIARGSIDSSRVGIGGVSTGTAVPLYMLQKYDRIAAVSISGPGWTSDEYYWGTRKGRQKYAATFGKMGGQPWKPKPDEEGREFWKKIDIAENIRSVRAPILMHLAEQEAWGAIRMIRHLDDAAKPYDAYIYRGETHIKWQSAHLHVIWVRNLDWFRFWLQGYEDPDPSKEDQYVRWRKLRSQHKHDST